MSASLFQIGHMPSVENVETPVGEDDLFVVCPGIINGQQQLVEGEHAALGALFTLDRPAQLRRADGSGTQFADHDTCSQVGQRDSVGKILAGGNGCGQGRDHGIAGTGDIEHFTGPGGQVQRRVPGAQQGHAMLATGHEQRAQFQIPEQLQTLGDQFGLVGATTYDRRTR